MLRRKQRWPAIVALAIVAAILAGSGVGGVLAYASVKAQASQLESQLTTQLQLGQTELEAAKTSLKGANASHNETLIAEAKVHFITAKLHFLTARQIANNSELLGRLERLPSVGQMATSRHGAVDDVSEMGIQIALAGQDLTDLDAQLIKPAGGGQQGSNLLTMLNQVHGKIGSVRTELDGALKAGNRVEISVLPAGQRASFLKARATIGQAIGAIDQFEALVPIITEILGGNGARTYLIEQVNPAELRPGGGFIGTYSVLRADHGTLSLVRSGNAVELNLDPRPLIGQRGYIAPPGPIREFVRDSSWTFVDSNFFPDFPSNARAAESFAQPYLGPIHGVICFDYYTVARLLELTGPIGVPGFNITLTSQNFIDVVVQNGLNALTDVNVAHIYKAILAAVAGPLLQRIVSLQPGQWPSLIGALNDLAGSRHLQAYFNNGEVQKTIDQFGWSGVQKTAAARDYMMELESNLGGTKANYFVTRHYIVELTRRGAQLQHKVMVDILDDMPYFYRPGEYYRAYIRLYISDTATVTYTDLAPPRYANPAPPAGTRMIDGWMLIHGYGHNRVVIFEWYTPWQPNGRGEEQMYWQKQPGTINDKVDVVWNDGNGHVFKVSGDLGQDRIITMAPSAVLLTQGQVGTAQLPSLSLG